jgi:hypothetical protein
MAYKNGERPIVAKRREERLAKLKREDPNTFKISWIFRIGIGILLAGIFSGK